MFEFARFLSPRDFRSVACDSGTVHSVCYNFHYMLICSYLVAVASVRRLRTIKCDTPHLLVPSI